MRISEAIIARIYELCDERGYTVNKLSNKAGITQSTLNDIVRGKNSATVITLQKLCDGLEITMRQFFDSDLFDHIEQEVR